MYHMCGRNNCVINRTAVKQSEIPPEVLGIKYWDSTDVISLYILKELKDVHTLKVYYDWR